MKISFEITTDDLSAARAKYENGGSLSQITGASLAFRHAMRLALIEAGCQMRSRESRPAHRMNPLQVERLLKLRQQGVSFTDLGEMFDVTGTTARNVYLIEMARLAGANV